MELKHGILCGHCLNFEYEKSLTTRTYVAEIIEPSVIVIGGFDVYFDESKYLVKIKYPCGCIVDIDSFFYINECKRRPPLHYYNGYRCPYCGIRMVK